MCWSWAAAGVPVVVGGWCGVGLWCLLSAGLVRVCWGGGLLGVVFGFFIVDASIFVASALCSISLIGGVCVRAVSVPCLSCRWPFWLLVGRVGCVCGVASYEGHMVDALASRADEGRSSLR